MSDPRRWRLAKFRCQEHRESFLARAAELGIETIEVEPLDDELGIRFRAPSRLEVGMATMVGAHGGRLIPCGDETPIGTIH